MAHAHLQQILAQNGGQIFTENVWGTMLNHAKIYMKSVKVQSFGRSNYNHQLPHFL